MKKNFKDILIRALKTFIQGFLGALAYNLPSADITSSDVIKSLIIGAIASGISAVMNIFINAYETKKEIEKENEDFSNEEGE